MQLDMLGGQLLGICAQRNLSRERQAREVQQILILDKDAVQRRVRPSGKPRRRVDRGAVLGGGVERHDDALDGTALWRADFRRVAHQRGSWPDASRASSAALAAEGAGPRATPWF